MNPHEELEIKFKADGVDFKSFNTYLNNNFNKIKKRHVTCPDVYYIKDKDVVRHRYSEDAGELTIKQRKSSESTLDRLEIDLKFHKDVTKENVEAFLVALGFKVKFILNKDSYIYHIIRRESGIESVLAYYTVGTNDNDIKSFIEVEIEKSNNINKAEAFKELKWWNKELKFNVGVGTPLNESLYEIYSGEKYKNAKISD